jgi:hypothetical protein
MPKHRTREPTFRHRTGPLGTAIGLRGGYPAPRLSSTRRCRCCVGVGARVVPVAQLGRGELRTLRPSYGSGACSLRWEATAMTVLASAHPRLSYGPPMACFQLGLVSMRGLRGACPRGPGKLKGILPAPSSRQPGRVRHRICGRDGSAGWRRSTQSAGCQAARASRFSPYHHSGQSKFGQAL